MASERSQHGELREGWESDLDVPRRDPVDTDDRSDKSHPEDKVIRQRVEELLTLLSPRPQVQQASWCV